MKKRSSLPAGQGKGRMSSAAGGPFEQALALHRQGQLALAEILYRQVLQGEPRHAQALGMLGLVEAAKGNGAAAIELLERSLVLDANNPAAHFNLGLLLQEQGRHEDALGHFDRTIALSPAAAQAQNARGMALKNLGRVDEAVAAYDAALGLVPDYFEALNNRAVALRYLGRDEAAVGDFANALRLRPDSVEVHVNLGFSLHKLQRFDEALASYARALELRPESHDAWNGRGMSLHGLDRFEHAVAAYRRALEIDPRSVPALMNLGVSLQQLRCRDEALAALERALQLQPGNLDVRVNLGNVLLELDRTDEAIEQFRQVLAARPQDLDVLMNMGNALRDLHRHDEALAFYERALTLDKNCADVHWNRAMCLLAMGDLERGWAEYEWRLRMPGLYDSTRSFGGAWWDGSQSLDGKTILIHAEQGLGDTLQFCRYATELQDRGAKVILEVQPPLASLLAGLAGSPQILPRGNALPPHDFHVALLSLPLAFGTTLATVPARVPYLRAQAPLVERWAVLLKERPGPHIGVAWSGNAAQANDHRRSIGLERLLPGLPGGITYWSLHKDVTPAEQALIQRFGRLERFEENDFANTAAQISVLDAVVTVDTSIAHLAGALGRPTFILLPDPADWRWLTGRSSSPWYPNATLVRQPSRGDWGGALQALAQRLRGLSATSGPGQDPG